MDSIYKTLQKLELTSESTRVLFNNRTRDVDNLNVWKDTKSGVIYIDDFYAGEQTYIDGFYRDSELDTLEIGPTNYEQYTDSQRRFKKNLKFVSGKRIADFGCGRGDFLRLVKPHCKEVIGIELQQNYKEQLNGEGISCFDNILKLEDDSLDIIVSFHVIEHLPNPLEILSHLILKVVSGGQILIEVPHANDFLLSTLDCEKFKQFTLWSQHLVLHTRESLRKTLEFVGFYDVQIEGVQRYPLSNHINWLANNRPGGHKSSLASLDSDALSEAYQNSLVRIDATDTLVAIAKVP
ncbi:class I SAM-dependent methyltransferase [Gammaproteobacteria bacterium]|nr:class I SAM-dependent methyltransferase [Gammaproteobacteria bacterium]